MPSTRTQVPATYSLDSSCCAHLASPPFIAPTAYTHHKLHGETRSSSRDAPKEPATSGLHTIPLRLKNPPTRRIHSKEHNPSQVCAPTANGFPATTETPSLDRVFVCPSSTLNNPESPLKVDPPPTCRNRRMPVLPLLSRGRVPVSPLIG
ncbi:unnamed protein product [Dicrocoelium dendriticum]|nr:unnamed protein product [Dicrocoelium dendriticum]